MPCMALPNNPAEVVVLAQRLGLTALREIMHDRCVRNTWPAYTAASEHLKNALREWDSGRELGRPDFSPIFDCERKLRSAELQNIWSTAARYGNREGKRVKSERKGVVGPLNRDINTGGSIMRAHFVCMYPMPQPTLLKKAHRRSVWAYDGGQDYGLVKVAHGADLPELDFVDMIRSHVRELARKAFILGVPSEDFSRYVSLLIRKLSVFTDYVYTSGEYGSAQFMREKTAQKRTDQSLSADAVLAEIVDELESLYGTETGRRVTPTRPVRQKATKVTSQIFLDQVARLREQMDSTPPVERERRQALANALERLSTGDTAVLGNRDAKKFHGILKTEARWRGIRCHRVLTQGFPKPWRLSSIVFNELQLDADPNGLVMAAEVPVDTKAGRGRADLVVFEPCGSDRTASHVGKCVYRPIAIFDIKTRSAFNWFLQPGHPRGERNKEENGGATGNFVTQNRGLTDEEWQRAVEECPTKSDLRQLDLYADGLIAEYGRLTGDSNHGSVLKGVILVDTEYDLGLAREMLAELVPTAIGTPIRKKATGTTKTVITGSHPAANRICILLQPQGQERLSPRGRVEEPLGESVHYDPLTEMNKTDGQFVLYLSVSSASHSGESTAWIARYWHGLQYLSRLTQGDTQKRVVWIDLTGSFSHRPLAETRLRISSQPDYARDVFTRTSFVNMSKSIDGYLFRGRAMPEIAPLLSAPEAEKTTVVVSGWDELEASTPLRLVRTLRELERSFVLELTELRMPTLWFGSPKLHEKTSAKYGLHCVIPFRNDSMLAQVTTEIVWNIPVRPVSITHVTPMLDDVRIIIDQRRNSVSSELVEVPPLRNWSARFRSERSKIPLDQPRGTGRGRPHITASDLVQSDRLQELREELILDSTELIPWIRKLWPKEFTEHPVRTVLNSEIEVQSLEGEHQKPGGLLSRVFFRPWTGRGGYGKSFVREDTIRSLEQISRPRIYHETRLKSKPLAQSCRPPSKAILDLDAIDETAAGRVERKRLTKTMQFLSGKVSGSEWRDFLRLLAGTMSGMSRAPTMQELASISELLKKHPVSKAFWVSLEWVRGTHFSAGLKPHVRQSIDDQIETRPDLPFLYGNYLFLLLLAVTRSHTPLNASAARRLWEAVEPWILVQLGLTFDKESVERTGRPKFDIRAIWSNLRKRVAFLSKCPVPVIAPRYGELLETSGDQGESNYWLFIEDERNRSELLSGVWYGENPLQPSNSVRWSEPNHAKVAGLARDAAKQSEVIRVMLTGAGELNLVWTLGDEGWSFLGRLTILRRKRDAATRIRGIRVEAIEERLVGRRPQPVYPSSVAQRVRTELERLHEQLGTVKPVRCQLGMERGFYLVRLHDKRDERILDSRVFLETAELLSFLRSPTVEGVPVISDDIPECQMTWDPYKDVDYGPLRLLQPYVKRRTPFINVRVGLPTRADELEQMEKTPVTVSVIHDESLCPIITDGFLFHAQCWRFETEDSGRDPTLDELCKTGMSDEEMSMLLSAGDVFLESKRYALRFDVEQLVSRPSVVLRESARLARQLERPALTPGTFRMMPEEKLTWSLESSETAIWLRLVSSVTSDEVAKQRIVEVTKEYDADTAMEHVEDAILEVASEYFGGGIGPRERIERYGELIAEIRRRTLALKRRGESK